MKKTNLPEYPLFALNSQELHSQRMFFIKGKNYGSTIFQHEVGLLFHRVKRSSINVFESIAAETGGKVYVTSTSEVEAIAEKEIKVRVKDWGHMEIEMKIK